MTGKCAYCGKKIKHAEYWPFCSYHCEQWGILHKNMNLVDNLKRKQANMNRAGKKGVVGE